MTNKESVKDDTYLDNLLLPRIGEYPFHKLATNKLAHANHVGMKATLLPLITKHLSPEISAISGYHPIRRSGSHLENTTDSSVIHSNQSTTAISRWGKGDWDVSLSITDSSPDVQREGLGRSGNNYTGTNSPESNGENVPLGAGWRSFDISIQGKIIDSVDWIPDFTNRRSQWHDEMFSENAG